MLRLRARCGAGELRPACWCLALESFMHWMRYLLKAAKSLSDAGFKKNKKAAQPGRTAFLHEHSRERLR